MKATTREFDKDLKVTTISQNSHRTGRPRIRRKVVKVAVAESSIKQKYIEEVDAYIGFRTRFTLYRGLKEYYLQISGIATDETSCPRKNKIITFEEPEDFAEILYNKEDNRVFWSPLTEELIDAIFESPYLTEDEMIKWDMVTVDDGE